MVRERSVDNSIDTKKNRKKQNVCNGICFSLPKQVGGSSLFTTGRAPFPVQRLQGKGGVSVKIFGL